MSAIWSEGEIERAVQLWMQGCTSKEVARTMKTRTAAAVSRKICEWRQLRPDWFAGERWRLAPKREMRIRKTARARMQAEERLRERMLAVYPAVTEELYVGPSAIVFKVATRHGLSVEDLLSGGQAARYSWARQEAMVELRKLSLSTPRIAALLRLKDHTTVLSGIKSYQRREARARFLARQAAAAMDTQS